MDEIKAKNRGWLVFNYPTVKELKERLASMFFLAAEADECPTRLLTLDGVLIFPSGIAEHDVRALIYRVEHPTHKPVTRSFFTHPFEGH